MTNEYLNGGGADESSDARWLRNARITLAFELIRDSGPGGISVEELRKAFIDKGLITGKERFDHVTMAVHYLRWELGKDIIVTDHKVKPKRYHMVIDLADSELNRHLLTGRLNRHLQMYYHLISAQRRRFTGYPGYDDEALREVSVLVESCLLNIRTIMELSAGIDNVRTKVKRRRRLRSLVIHTPTIVISPGEES